MKQLIALLALCASQSFAATLSEKEITAMVGQCKCVMEGGVCGIETGKFPRVTQPRLIAGFGYVQPDDYNYIHDAGDAMCQRGEEELRKDDRSPRSMSFRSRFRKDWDGVCLYPPVLRATDSKRPK